MIYNESIFTLGLALTLAAILSPLVGMAIYYYKRYASMLQKLSRFIRENSRLSRENQYLRVELTRLSDYKPAAL